MDLGLTDRVYILTGASRGLGYATAESLVRDGARVVITGRTRTTLDAAVERLSAASGAADGAPHAAGGEARVAGGAPHAAGGEPRVAGGAPHAAGGEPRAAGGGPRAVGVVADLADADSPDRLVALAYERFGRLDGALISVGGPRPGTILATPDEAWVAAIHSVFLGAIRMARTVATSLEPGGAIALVLSTSVRNPLPNLSISNALRPGLAGFAKDLADEVGPRGIRVFGLLPGRFLTDRNRELFDATGDAEAAAAQAAAAIPLRRLGEPEEFGRVAAFALSPAASYISGISLPVDAGYTRAL